jgi:kinesin family member 2/24
MVEEEDDILREHMESIQVNANLLTQEGALLARVQGKGVVDYDIDAYASRLAEILQRKLDVTSSLLERLRVFRGHLAEEEELSRMRAEAEERQLRGH